MSKTNQSLLARIAILISVFALLMVVAVAVTKDGGSGGGSDSGSAPVAVALSEFAISPATVTVKTGGKLQVTNNGTTAHNLSITDTDLKTKDLAAGASETLDLSSLKPGTYEIFCAIPGHKDAGMKGSLTISDNASASSGDAAAHGSHDLNSLTSASDPIAKELNKATEKGMTDGVNTFLANAKKYAAGDIKPGNELLQPTVLADGTKRFDLTAAVTDWEVSPGKVVKAWTYNGRVPGPYLKVNEGDKVEVVLKNELPVSTDIHFHGISVPNTMDGVAPITQKFIEPGDTFTYKFTTVNHPELAMYHAHMHGQVAIPNGLFAAIQVGELPLPAGKTVGYTDIPADVKVSQEFPMVLNDAGVIGLSLNGKSFPETAPVAAKKGDWILVHYYNEGLVGHPMHLHRQPQIVIAKDGFPLATPYQMDTLWIGPGERYSVLVNAAEPGVWAWHCHILNHAENDNGLTGMVTAMVVDK